MGLFEDIVDVCLVTPAKVTGLMVSSLFHAFTGHIFYEVPSHVIHTLPSGKTVNVSLRHNPHRAFCNLPNVLATISDAERKLLAELQREYASLSDEELGNLGLVRDSSSKYGYWQPYGYDSAQKRCRINDGTYRYIPDHLVVYTTGKDPMYYNTQSTHGVVHTFTNTNPAIKCR